MDHSKIDYLPIKKDFFILPSAVKAMTEVHVPLLMLMLRKKLKPNDGTGTCVSKEMTVLLPFLLGIRLI